MGSMTVFVPAPVEPTMPDVKPFRPNRGASPLSLPVNDNNLDRKKMVFGPRTGVLVSRGLRIGIGLPLVDTAINIVEALDSMEWYPDPFPWKLPSGWYLQADSGRRPGNPPYAPNNIGARGDPRIGHISNFSAGQVPGSGSFVWDAGPNNEGFTFGSVTFGTTGDKTLFLSDARTTPAVRYRHDVVFWYDGMVAGTTVNFPYMYSRPLPNYNPMADPNIVRNLPPMPSNLPDPQGNPRPSPRARPGTATEAPPEWQWETGRNPRPRSRPRLRRRPPRGHKDKKILSQSKRFMLWLFNALDALSENSEIIGAFFDALPKDVRDRWSKGREDRPFVDNGGQYGIDGADWKLQAVYHNWHKIDAEQALTNVARNLLQDQLYGVVHKNLPPGAFRAITRDDKTFNDLVDDLLDLVDPRTYGGLNV